MFRRPLHHRGRTGKQRHRGPFGLSGAAKLSRARDCEKLRVVNLCYARRIHRSRRLRPSTTMVLSGRSVICVWSSCWQLTSPRSPAGRPAPAAVRVARFWQRGWRQALRAAPGVGLGRCGFLAHGVAHCSRWWHRCCGAPAKPRSRWPAQRRPSASAPRLLPWIEALAITLAPSRATWRKPIRPARGTSPARLLKPPGQCLQTTDFGAAIRAARTTQTISDQPSLRHPATAGSSACRWHGQGWQAGGQYPPVYSDALAPDIDRVAVDQYLVDRDIDRHRPVEQSAGAYIKSRKVQRTLYGIAVEPAA